MKNILKRSTAYLLLLAIFGSILSFLTLGGSLSRFSALVEASTRSANDFVAIEYTEKEETYIETLYGVPEYYQLGIYPNSCGPTAGAIIVGFYDKYYDELIPDYTSTLSSGAYRFTDSVYIPNLIGELYTLMRTNVDDAGVSETDCLNGLRAYVQNHGRNLSYTSVYGTYTIDSTAYINAIRANKPVIVFCTQMDIYNIALDPNCDTVYKKTYVGNHVLVAYGYLEIKYYAGSNIPKADRYLAVSTGVAGIRGYIKLDSSVWCDSAYAVTVN